MILHQHEDAYTGYEIFHSDLQTLIKEEGLVAVRFPCYDSYWEREGKSIFFPTEEEMSSPRLTEGHVTLVSGSSRDEEGNLYYQCQESFGTQFGVEGYTRIYANLIMAYVEMTV